MLYLFLLFVTSVFSDCSSLITYEGDSRFFDCAKCEYLITECEVPESVARTNFESLATIYGADLSSMMCRLESDSLTNVCLEELPLYDHNMTVEECLSAMYTGVTLAPTADNCLDCKTRMSANEGRTQFTISTEQVTTTGAVGCACLSNLTAGATLRCPGGQNSRSGSAAADLSVLF